MENRSPTIYTALLFTPALGFFLPNQEILAQAHFLLVVTLIASSFACYHLAFKSEYLNVLRKCLGCVSTALIVTYLSAEVGDILSSVYQVPFSDEVSFFCKIVLMISNMEGNLDLCLDKQDAKFD